MTTTATEEISPVPAPSLPVCTTVSTVSRDSRLEQIVLTDPHGAPQYSLRRTITIFSTLTGITTASTMSTGVLAVALPRMAKDLSLSDSLLLWPVSVYGLTSGCSMMLAGSIADVVGNRSVYLLGCFLLGFFVLASGLAQTGTQLIIFRGFQGVAVSLCLPTATSILTEAFPNGRRRNIGFAIVGAGQPTGYAIGILLGGFFVDTIGWRYAWYLSAAVALAVFGIGLYGLPRKDRHDERRQESSWQRLAIEVDWIGLLLASTCMGILSYVLATVTGGASRIRDAQSIALLIIAAAAVPTFIFWMNRQERHGKATLIPNSIWKKRAFTAICTMVFLQWAANQTVEYYLSLYFQKVLGLSATQSSIHFLPDVIIGVILSIVTGLILHKYSAYYIVLCTTFIAASSPLLMALVDPRWSYWYLTFWAVLFAPVSCDVLFVISSLVITSEFPDTTQALAGAVFNTVAQFGIAVGLAVMATISSTVTEKSRYPSKSSPDALLEGYRASFWTSFGAFILALSIGVIGLKGIGKVGLKRE